MTRYFKATFSDGFTAKRSSTSRDYTHAWRVGRETGFSSSAQLAAKAVASWTSRDHADLPREVAGVEEITSKEYRRVA